MQAKAMTSAKVGTPTAGPTANEVFQLGRKHVFDQLPTVDSSHITDYNQVSWEAEPPSPNLPEEAKPPTPRHMVKDFEVNLLVEPDDPSCTLSTSSFRFQTLRVSFLTVRDNFKKM
jgi:hypothetical protein